MKRVCFLIKIKKDRVNEYLNAHKVWPEMQEAISDVGIKNYSMFIRKDGMAVGYFEAENPEESLRKLGQTDVNRRWQRYVSEYFEGVSGDLEEESIDWLDQYFYLE